MTAIVGHGASGRYSPYPEYKDSGVGWLGRIPDCWETKRLKLLARVASGFAPPESFDRSLGEHPVYGANGPIGYCDQFLVAEPTLAVGRVGASGSVNVVPARSWVSDNALLLLELRPTVHLAWLRYALEAMNLGTLAAKNAQPIITGTFLGNQVVATPLEFEQQAIARFLDRETARIDAMVAKKDRLIELLQERRTSLVERAVRGDPGCREVRLGHCVDLLPGYAFKSEGFSRSPEDIRLLRGINIAPGEIRWDDMVYWPRTDASQFKGYALQVGDLVLGMDRPWIGAGIRVAQVAIADLPALLLQRVARLRARSGLLQAFLRIIISSPQFHAYFEPILTGVSVPHISPEQILGFRVRIPSASVQEVICQRLSEEFGRIESMIESLNASINLITELRASLISAAVTGKIDVRGETGA